MSEQKYIQIAEPFLDEQEWVAVKAPLESGWLTQGPKVKDFEQAFALRHKVANALAVTSCTTALHLALLALGVGPGDAVVVPSFTWVATANVVEYCGARPYFCDSCRDTYNLDLSRLEQLLDDLQKRGVRPKAVIAVHLFGLMTDMAALNEMADRYSFRIVEDAACAAGADQMGRPAGGWGEVGCFSFHPRKIITTGEGGMCTTNNDLIAAHIGQLRSHGASLSEEQRHSSDSPFLMPDFNEVGYNYRMSDLLGAVGLVQLTRLDNLIAQRRKLAAFYDEHLKDLNWLITPNVPADFAHSFQAYVCLVDRDRQSLPRNEIMGRLQKAGIASRAGTHAIHELGFYRDKYRLAPSDLPVASELYSQTITLPLHNKMTEDDCWRVVSVLKGIDTQ
jgi:Predicted pyridoxal phosphate-dependent enzyme apparently involved in regulation of cell wall biogenesis